MSAGSTFEPDVFLQGEDSFAGRGSILSLISETIDSMDEGDLIWFLVIPADMSAHEANRAIPLAYHGPKPSEAQLRSIGWPECGALSSTSCMKMAKHATRGDRAHEGEGGSIWF